MYRLWSAVRSTILPTTIQKWMLPPNLSGAIPARRLIITGIDSVTGTLSVANSTMSQIHQFKVLEDCHGYRAMLCV